MKRDTKTNLWMLICLLGVVGMGTPCAAQQITGDIPYPDMLLSSESPNTLKSWNIAQARLHKNATVGVSGNSTLPSKQKDHAAESDFLGYSSSEVESKTFSGTLDLTNATEPASVAILVDDNATLTITSPAEGDKPLIQKNFVLEGDALWKSKAFSESSDSDSLPPGRIYNLTLVYENTINLTEQYDGWIDRDGVSVYVCLAPKPDVMFLTPAGDPESAPVTAGLPPAPIPLGANEFTFSGSTDSATVLLQAEVKGYDSMTAEQRDAFRFEIDPIAGSTLEWGPDNPGGKPSYQEPNQIWATAIYYGTPASNASFGRKTARVKRDGAVAATASFEMFFPRDAIAPPTRINQTGRLGGIGYPNWFFYWIQTVEVNGPNPTFYYGSDCVYYPSQTNRIYLSERAKGAERPVHAPEILSGIDTFAWVVWHESRHYADFCEYWDVHNEGVTKWQNAIGKEGPNDNKDGQIGDNGRVDYLPNFVEDVNLNKVFDAGDLYNWNDLLTDGVSSPELPSDAEDYTHQRGKNIRGDHSQDWANPGMQHQTLGKYDD